MTGREEDEINRDFWVVGLIDLNPITPTKATHHHLPETKAPPVQKDYSIEWSCGTNTLPSALRIFLSGHTGSVKTAWMAEKEQMFVAVYGHRLGFESCISV